MPQKDIYFVLFLLLIELKEILFRPSLFGRTDEIKELEWHARYDGASCTIAKQLCTKTVH
jgi:hypothetical protein